jgi:hypothetical protein
LFSKANPGFYEPYSRANGTTLSKSNERRYPTTRSASNFASEFNKDMIKTLRQKHLIPSASRIRKDMKAFEKKFYERYLSAGYKL